MIRKGLKPVIRPGFDLPGRPGGFRRVLPFKRAWVPIVVLAVFDAAFLFPAVSTLQQVMVEWGKFDDLFDLTTALFLTAWLLGWSIAPLLMTTVLAVMLFGREVVRARPGVVELFIGLPLLGVRARYDPAKMRNLRLELPIKKSGRSWRGRHLAFDYGANSGAFGSDIDAVQADELKSAIEKATGAPFRRGEATEDELSGAWNSPLQEALKPVAAAPALQAAPVKLFSPSTLALIVANLVPVVGALFLDWRLSDVMVLYWAESAVIGFFNLAKIVVIGRWMALLAGPFFVGHFGAFMAVHFMFLYMLFVKGPQDNTGGDLAEVGLLFVSLWPGLAALFISHAYSFFANFIGRSEYQGHTLQTQMSEPYTRIMFMHLVLILGGGLTLVIGEPAPVLVLVIGLKIYFDVKAHLKQRVKPGPSTGREKVKI